ncbi:MAG: hypothetical protein K2X09_04960 [Rickettsiales bacterium]|nr:hypothetical protein [Rickettsiales bacterium]
MSYTNEMTLAEINLQRAMQQWNIVQQRNPAAGTGVFIDTDTRQNGTIVPTRMEYVRTRERLQVTRIQQGDTVIYGRDAQGQCHQSQEAVDAFFKGQPQMEAVMTMFPARMFIPYGVGCR